MAMARSPGHPETSLLPDPRLQSLSQLFSLLPRYTGKTQALLKMPRYQLCADDA